MKPAVRLDGISKRFGATHALQNVSIDVMPGEVLALLGENGAGKSTLIKILAGVYQPDAGTISVSGTERQFASPEEAIRAGVVLIPQDLQIFKPMTVAENICVHKVPTKRVFGIVPSVDQGAMRAQAVEVLGRIGSQIDPDLPMTRLSFAERQVVAIARALSQDANVLILDEPTASLEDREVALLFEQVERLKKRGVAIIYITHRMHEVLRIADRCVVLRDGKHAGHYSAGEFDLDSIIRDMTGGLSTAALHERRRPQVDRAVSVEVELDGEMTGLGRGEIVGVAGLIGSGAAGLLKRVFGAETGGATGLKTSRGKSEVRNSADAIANGVGFVSGERSLGLLHAMSVRDNIILPHLEEFSNPLFLRTSKINRLIGDLIQLLDIRPADPDLAAGRLSGGNQQKVLFARWLVGNLDLLLLDDPTAGVDVGAKTQIHNLIEAFAERGGSVMLASTDLPEMMALSDRIFAIRNSQVVGQLSRDGQFDEMGLRSMMGGA